MSDDWQRVSGYLQRRISHLKLSKAEVIRRSGVSQKSLDGYLEGAPIVRADKARGLCQTLGWTLDSIDRILAGDEPIELEPKEEDAAATKEIDARLTALEDWAERTEQAMERLLRAAGLEP